MENWKQENTKKFTHVSPATEPQRCRESIRVANKNYNSKYKSKHDWYLLKCAIDVRLIGGMTLSFEVRVSRLKRVVCLVL